MATVVSRCLVGVILLVTLAANSIGYTDNERALVEQYASGSQQVTLRSYPFPSLVHDDYNEFKNLQSLQRLECEQGRCNQVRQMAIFLD